MNINVTAYGIQTEGITGTQAEIWDVVTGDSAGNSGESFDIFAPIGSDSGHASAAI